MRTFLYGAMVVFASMTVFTGIAISSYEFVRTRFFQPIVYHKVELLTAQPVKSDSDITFRIHRTKRTLCASTFEIYFTALPMIPNVVPKIVYQTVTPGAFTPIGKGYVDFTIHLPKLPSGRYQFTEVSRLLCGGESFTAMTPQVIFAVE